MSTPFTAKQGQYLAFIYYCSKIHGIPPAEADFQRFFRVTPPVVHQMVKTLHAQGFIDRELGKARSIQAQTRSCRIAGFGLTSAHQYLAASGDVEDQQRWMNSRISGSSNAMQREESGTIGEHGKRPEEQYETMRDAGAFDEDAVIGATDVILFERARALLLGGAALDDLR